MHVYIHYITHSVTLGDAGGGRALICIHTSCMHACMHACIYPSIHYITYSVTLGDAGGARARGVVGLAGRAVCERRGRECVHAVRAGPVPDLGTGLGLRV